MSRSFAAAKSVMAVVYACLPSTPDSWEPLEKVFLSVSYYTKSALQPIGRTEAYGSCYEDDDTAADHKEQASDHGCRLLLTLEQTRASLRARTSTG